MYHAPYERYLSSGHLIGPDGAIPRKGTPRLRHTTVPTKMSQLENLPNVAILELDDMSNGVITATIETIRSQ
ncbi:hypothetical protein GB937_002288 [Aspergillus fischeri]|nr:hypothetical protein GB937_002288 [Aspergillus fischeri]